MISLADATEQMGPLQQLLVDFLRGCSNLAPSTLILSLIIAAAAIFLGIKNGLAKKVVKAIEKNKIFKGIPFGFHFIRFWQTVLPVKIFDFFFGKVFGIYHAMDKFTGRKSGETKA